MLFPVHLGYMRSKLFLNQRCRQITSKEANQFLGRGLENPAISAWKDLRIWIVCLFMFIALWIASDCYLNDVLHARVFP